eukprot:222037-Lingulodinium_polyedra.AAC.1
MELQLMDAARRKLRVVQWYKHVSGIVWPDSRMGPEVKCRTGSTYGALASLRTLLARRDLTVTVK